GGHEHDAAPAASAKPSQEGAGDADRPHEVDVDGPVPALLADLVEQSPGPVDAGDVDEDVEVTHLGGDLRGEIVDGGVIGDIGIMGVDPLLVLFQFVDG